MTNKPLLFLGIFFILIGVVKCGYALIMKKKK